MCVFFFKQKTAYEMRISDWSSDVCSSDLEPRNYSMASPSSESNEVFQIMTSKGYLVGEEVKSALYWASRVATNLSPAAKYDAIRRKLQVIVRSEEHTSELQSLMRISYAVFCLKKKKT